jgi:hypothetical protein
MTESDSIDRPRIRRTVRETITAVDATGVERSDLLDTVSATADVPADAVEAELDELERLGFVYLVGEEVRLP